jgi:hypothetical protein
MWYNFLIFLTQPYFYNDLIMCSNKLVGSEVLSYFFVTNFKQINFFLKKDLMSLDINIKKRTNSIKFYYLPSLYSLETKYSFYFPYNYVFYTFRFFFFIKMVRFIYLYILYSIFTFFNLIVFTIYVWIIFFYVKLSFSFFFLARLFFYLKEKKRENKLKWLRKLRRWRYIKKRKLTLRKKNNRPRYKYIKRRLQRRVRFVLRFKKFF